MHVLVSALLHNVATFGDGDAAFALSGIFGHGVATLAMNRFKFFFIVSCLLDTWLRL